MTFSVCPICNKTKDGVGPKLVGKKKIKDERLSKPMDALVTKIMCSDCWKKLRK